MNNDENNGSAIEIQGLNVLIQKSDQKINSKQIIFVHGAWHGAWCYQEHFMSYFSKKGFDCYAIDLRGHGQSKGRKKLRFSSLNNYLKDVRVVVNHLAINNKEKKPIIVGHSMGGLIVQKYAKKYPDTVDKVVLLAPASRKGVLLVTIRVIIHHPLTFLKMNLFMSLYPLLKDFKRFKKFLFSDTLPDDKLRAYHQKIQDESFRAYLDMMILGVSKKKIQNKTLILSGEKDTIFRKHDFNGIIKNFNAEIIMIPNMAHAIMLEKNWEQAADKILSWIAKV